MTECLQALAIKLYSAVPHSMADERTLSVVTMINTALRNRQGVETIMAMTQVRGYYKSKAKVSPQHLYSPSKKKLTHLQLRPNSRPRPTVKFYNLKRLLREIDDDDEAKKDPNRDDSDYESDTETPIQEGGSFEFEVGDRAIEVGTNEDDINIGSAELHDILADQQIVEQASGDVHQEPRKDGLSEEGGLFELGQWIQTASQN